MGGAMIAVQAGTAILGGIAEQKALEKQQEFNNQINEVNQQASRNKIEEIKQQSLAKRRAISKRGDKLKGKAISAVAKSGVLLTGSPMDVVLENEANVEQDRMNTFRDGQILQQNVMHQASMDNYITDVKNQELETKKETAMFKALTGVAGSLGGLASLNQGGSSQGASSQGGSSNA